MPYALIIAGIILTVAGVRNTQGALYTLLEGDFTGQNNFVFWTLSILIIGAFGYIPDLRKLANTFLALILVVLFIAHNKDSVFSRFVGAFNQPIPPAPVPK